MAGLLGFMAAGAAQGYAKGVEQNTQTESQFNLTAMQNEIKAMMEDRIYERTKQDKDIERTKDIAGQKELIAARARSERESDPNKAKREALLLSETERKANKEKLLDEIKAAKAELKYAEGMDPKDKEFALRDLDKQEQAILGMPKPATEQVTTKTKKFTDEGEEETTVKGTRPVASKSGASPVVSTKEQYDALPSGSTYIGTNGKTYRKP